MISMIKQSNMSKYHLRNDIILILALLIVAVLGGIYLFLFRENGDMVRVTINGESYGVYPLSQDIVEDIYTGENDSQLNRLVIREGKAFVETATCPDGICAAHRSISRNGESIVCLPHRVVISVETAERVDTPDIVV